MSLMKRIKKGRRLLDKDIRRHDYGSFAKCRLSPQNDSIEFVLTGGAMYEVKLDYFLRWHEHPHFLRQGRKLDDLNATVAGRPQLRGLKFAGCRRIRSRTAVRIQLNNGYVYDVPWDTVLMACEKNYEHFGGLTSKSQELVERRG